MRALYGTDGTQNATHGSDSPASAQREIKFFFPDLILDEQAECCDGERYIMEQLQPSLLKGLTALAKEKPTAEKYEAITWLAQWLLRNNPNQAKIFTPDQWVTADDDQDDEIEILEQEQRAAARKTKELAQAVAAAETVEGSSLYVKTVGCFGRAHLSVCAPAVSARQGSIVHPMPCAMPSQGHGAHLRVGPQHLLLLFGANFAT